MPQHDNTVLESDSRLSARPVQALLSGSSTCTLQQSGGGYPRERIPAALSKVENAGGSGGSAMRKRDIDLLPPTTVQSLEATLWDDTPIGPVAVARGTPHSTDATLADRTEPYSDTSAHNFAFFVFRALYQWLYNFIDLSRLAAGLWRCCPLIFLLATLYDSPLASSAFICSLPSFSGISQF